MPSSPRRLVVTADDFGASPSVNAAVARAHHEGILTAASLMVSAPAAAEAASLARQSPRLGLGLHLVLVQGRSARPGIPASQLCSADGAFLHSPVHAGLKYFFHRSLRHELTQEIDAQFNAFHALGLPLDHVNGHLNLHLHPVILDILLQNAERYRLRHLRLTCDPLALNLQLASGSLAYRFSHALIFRLLSARARPRLRRAGVRHTHRVFGLLQNSHVDEAFVCRLLDRLPPGNSELYSHPCTVRFKNELDALVSREAIDRVRRGGIELICYKDLS